MNLEWFELAEKLFFKIDADYKVNDVNGRDVQCTYDVVKGAYIDQVFNKYYNFSSSSPEDRFYADLGVNDEASAQQAVYDLCNSAQDALHEM